MARNDERGQEEEERRVKFDPRKWWPKKLEAKDEEAKEKTLKVEAYTVVYSSTILYIFSSLTFTSLKT